MRTAIWWIRRDLRMRDNHALYQAAQSADNVAAVYILDPVLSASGRVGPKRTSFLYSSLRALDQSLRSQGGRLIVRRGDPVDVLRGLLSEIGAERIWAETDFTAYARRRDAAAAKVLPVEFTPGLTALAPGSVLKVDGQPYVVFTPFARRWKQEAERKLGPVLPTPGQAGFVSELDGIEINQGEQEQDTRFIAGEEQAWRRLTEFVESGRVYNYRQGRDRLDHVGTSLLSPYLRFGMLSARQAIYAAQEAIDAAVGEGPLASASQWLDELIWREFYHHILFHYPEVQFQSFRPAYRQFDWVDDRAVFEAWKEGRTGYPIIDAAMRQLKAEGWMPNRTRMLTASFLAKHLLLDWRWGERWFMRNLIDGDVAANNGGWQWAAGTGTDAAPYFRIFNPTLQAKKHDPDGAYVRRWLPELAGLKAEQIHEPWKLSASDRKAAGASQYPMPIVEHAWARQRALDRLAPKSSTSIRTDNPNLDRAGAEG